MMPHSQRKNIIIVPVQGMKTYNPHETDMMKSLQGAELASFTRRFFALLVDILLAIALFIIIPIQPLFIKLGWLQPGKELIFTFFGNWYSTVWLALYFAISIWTGNGKTPGKWILRVRVVSLVHKRITPWQSVERALGYGASILELGFGFLQYFIHPNCRTVHDRIAETIVVRVRGK